MAEAPLTVQITVDGEAIGLRGPTASGATIKASAGRDAIYQLFREASGTDPDELIADHQSLVIENGMRFYTVPPAMMGVRWGL